jgi:hypothetical protein
MRPLRSALLDEPLAKLMAIVDVWDATIQATSQKEIADALAVHALQPDTARDVRDGLPAQAQAALTALLRSGGKIPVAAFERRFGVIRPMGPGRLERERPWTAPVSPAETLWYRGLIFRAFDKAGGAPVESIYIPSDLQPLLDDGATQAEAAAPVRAPSALNADDASPLLDDVTTILCFAQNHDVRVRADGLWDANARQSLARMLRDPDGTADAHPDRRFAFLLNALNRLGWLRAQDGRLRLSPQPVSAWLQQDGAARRDALMNAWRNDPDWNDLSHVETIELQMQHSWANDPLRERHAILTMLDAWVAERSALTTADAFVAHVKLHNPDFARVDGRYDTWHVRDVLTGAFLQGFDAWDRIEAALIRYVIAGPLRWLEDNRVVYESGQTGEAPAAPFLVGGDGAITISAALAFERFQLSRVADWLDKQPGAYVYALTPRSLKRASDQGIKPQRVREFLEDKSNAPLPARLVGALDRWAERGPEARIESALLLRTRDGATLDALLKLDPVRRAVLERLAPNCALIRAHDARAVRVAIAGSGALIDLAL